MLFRSGRAAEGSRDPAKGRNGNAEPRRARNGRRSRTSVAGARRTSSTGGRRRWQQGRLQFRGGEERDGNVQGGRQLTRNELVGSEAKGTAGSDGNRAGRPPDREEGDDGGGSI